MERWGSEPVSARMAVRYVAKKSGVLVGFHERASSYVADIRQCEVLPKKVSDLLLPLRELVHSLTLHERLPQIELAVGSVMNRTAVMLVFRVLQPPTAEDCRLLREFGSTHEVEIWLQPAGPDSAAPLDQHQAQRLELRLPEFDVALPFSPTDFTQVNHRVNEVLVSRVVRLLAPRAERRCCRLLLRAGQFHLAARHARKDESSASKAAHRWSSARASLPTSNGLTDRTQFEARNLFDFRLDDWHSLCARHRSDQQGADRSAA